MIQPEGAVDRIQDALRPLMKARGFKVRGRTFNGLIEDGLTQVVSMQAGQRSTDGLLTVSLGIYVPEVARRLTGKVQTWVQEYDCCVRTRLGQTTDNPGDKWWPTHPERDVADEVQRYLHLGGFPFLDRFSSRVEIERARALLERQATEAPVPAHADYVRKLAKALGVENLDA